MSSARTPALSCAGIATCWFGSVQPSDFADIELCVPARTTRLKCREHRLFWPLQVSGDWAPSAGEAAKARPAITPPRRRTRCTRLRTTVRLVSSDAHGEVGSVEG